jgi:hypothetical protein
MSNKNRNRKQRNRRPQTGRRRTTNAPRTNGLTFGTPESTTHAAVTRLSVSGENGAEAALLHMHHNVAQLVDALGYVERNSAYFLEVVDIADILIASAKRNAELSRLDGMEGAFYEFDRVASALEFLRATANTAAFRRFSGKDPFEPAQFVEAINHLAPWLEVSLPDDTTN